MTPAQQKREAVAEAVEGFTLRSVLLGFAAVVLLCLIAPYQDLVLQNMLTGGNSSPTGAHVLFLVILALNAFLKAGRLSSLSGKELLLIYCMLLAASGIPSMGLVIYLLPTLIGPFAYATAENEWETIFHPHIPSWLVPSTDAKSEVIEKFVSGGSAVPWSAWIGPLLIWTTFVLALYAMMICLCVLLRKQWIEHERLSFPLVQLPLALVGREERPTAPLFRNRLVWVGAALTFVIYSWNALTAFFPSMPKIRLGHNLNHLIIEYPWLAMRPLQMLIFPAVIGVFYLVPQHVTFSLWFFYLLTKLERVVGASLGTHTFTDNSKAGFWYASSAELHQAMGALIVLTLAWFWLARTHLWRALRGRSSSEETDREALPLWLCALGLVGSIVYLSLFSAAGGMSFVLALGVFVCYAMICLGLTRIVTEGGVMYVQSPFQPTEMITTPLGTTRISIQSMTMMAFQYPFYFDMAGFLMPSIMNSFRIADSMRMRRRTFLVIIGATLLVAIGVSYYSFLTVVYKHGGNVKLGHWFFVNSPTLPFRMYAVRHQDPRMTDWHGVSFIITGAALTLATVILRARFYWWPIHPVGCLLMGTWVLYHLWFTCFLAWVIKGLILRYGGSSLYRKLRPFFLGLVLGGFLTPGVWAIIDLIVGRDRHYVSAFISG